jgi:FixJ family two-component response regulator
MLARYALPRRIRSGSLESLQNGGGFCECGCTLPARWMGMDLPAGEGTNVHPTEYTVFVVDDDADERDALWNLFHTFGYRVCTFDCAEAFLDQVDEETPGCVLLDLHLPDLSGLELQRRLVTPAYTRPVVFLTALASVHESVCAMKAGAVDFLMKPALAQYLLPAIETALTVEATRRRELAASRDARDRTARLTPREREVLEHLVRGLLNKQIAAALGTTEKTVKVHRARVLQKTGARSVVQLVRFVSQTAGHSETGHIAVA